MRCRGAGDGVELCSLVGFKVGVGSCEGIRLAMAVAVGTAVSAVVAVGVGVADGIPPPSPNGSR